MTIILYTATMSSATPVEHALLELQVPHEKVRLDLPAGDQKKPEYLAINPNGKVPALVVDGTAMFEALAIMQWLGDRFGVERKLWPEASAPERMVASSWSTWAYVTYGAVLHRYNHAASERGPSELHHAASAEHAREELSQLLKVVDGHLAQRPYLLGESFSLADLIVASVITYGTYCGISVEGHAHVQAWLERFQGRAAYREIWGAE